MKKEYLRTVMLFSLLITFLVISCSGDDGSKTSHTIMQPDFDTYHAWHETHMNLPEEEVKPKVDQVESYPTSYSLIEYMDYDVETRTQGGCGNCWAWAGTGVFNIALNQQISSNVNLSVQWFNSLASNSAILSDYGGPPYYFKGPCCGGLLDLFANIYNDYKNQSGYDMTVPWSNENAEFQDGISETCESSVNYQNISTDNAILFESTLQANQIAIESTEDAMITSMKNALVNNKRGIWFAMYLPNHDAWHGPNGFETFWKSQPVSDLWNPNSFCGSTYVTSGPNKGGGHAIIISGYYDDGTEANSYWEVLNSWPINSGRPQDMFRLKMRGLNYNCTYENETSSGTRPSFMFGTLSGVTYVPSSD